MIENNAIQFISPVYASSLGNFNAAVVFLDNLGEAQFNHNNLYISKPSGTQQGYVNGVYISGLDGHTATVSAMGNTIDGGSTGLTSNAVVVAGDVTSGAVTFNWNQICNWTQGYFQNGSTSITVDGKYNTYCSAVPTSDGSTATIHGNVTYLPVSTGTDEDSDGVDNLHDTCPTVANPGAGQTADVDADGKPDACDRSR